MTYTTTTRYEASHGRRPRGTGTWGFFFGSNTEPWWAPFGTYTQARRAAEAEARRRGETRVTVAP